MSDLFERIDVDRGQRRGLVTRRIVMGVFAVISVLALIDTFGQKQTSSQVANSRVRMKVTAPSRVRGGLLFQSKIEIHALDRIAHPRLVLDDGWVEGMQVNSTEPQPGDEESRDGRLTLSYTTLEAGDVLKVWMQFQVNPTNVGHRPYGIELDDDMQPVAHISRHITVLP